MTPDQTHIPTSVAATEVARTEQFLEGVVKQGLIAKPANATDAATATSQFGWLKDKEKELKERETAITKPLNDALKGVRALFAPVRDRLAGMITQVKSGLEQYNADVEAALEKQRAKLAHKVEAGALTEGQAKREIVKAATAGGAGVIPTSKHRVVVVIDEAKVPDRYWVLDMVKVRRDALDGRRIPGVEVREEQRVVNR